MWGAEVAASALPTCSPELAVNAVGSSSAILAQMLSSAVLAESSAALPAFVLDLAVRTNRSPAAKGAPFLARLPVRAWRAYNHCALKSDDDCLQSVLLQRLSLYYFFCVGVD